MKSQDPSRKQLRSVCDDPGPEDGVDPRTFLREPRPRVPNRKALQLCAQVARTLQEVLQGECGDDLLRDLLVESVVPAPNGARLLVTVSLVPGGGPFDPARVLEHLAGALGKLRVEIAAAIHRKKAPELVFRVGDANGDR